jgi:hypothetical protein
VASTKKRWSQHVSETSDALDLTQGVFAQSDPKKVARSLKGSAEHSDHRKSDPYRSAMSMLTFYINRAGIRSATPATASSSAPRTSCAPCSASAPTSARRAKRRPKQRRKARVDRTRRRPPRPALARAWGVQACSATRTTASAGFSGRRRE